MQLPPQVRWPAGGLAARVVDPRPGRDLISKPFGIQGIQVERQRGPRWRQGAVLGSIGDVAHGSHLLGERGEVEVGEAETDEEQVACQHQGLHDAVQRGPVVNTSLVVRAGEHQAGRPADGHVQFEQPPLDAYQPVAVQPA